MTMKKRIISLHKKLGIKYEKTEKFEESFFRDVYYQAFINTKYIIESEGQSKGLKKNERMYNIIPFWGERGTGKTSAMSSFIESLNNFDNEAYEAFKKMCEKDGKKDLMSSEDMGKYGFLCLECIDASLLEDHDNIVELILAKMLEKFIERNKDISGKASEENPYESKITRYNKNVVMSKFDEIYDSLRNIRSDEREAGIAALEVLKKLSGSLDLRDRINDFVPLFLKTLMSDKGKNVNNQFLVISIDDLDMKDKNGYEILENLHRYFMVPHVLIYITLSGEALLNMCYQHFSEKNGVVGMQKKMAMSYIDKVLPFSNRIYMPLVSEEEVYTKIENEGNEKPIKERFLSDIAKKTGVYFDGCGVKRHFYEPDNMRMLINTYRMLENMSDSNSDDGKLYNISLLLEDINNRLSLVKLSNEQYRLFDSIRKMAPERQGFSFAQYFKEVLKEGKYTIDYIYYTYSYGELLRGIYTLGREKTNEKQLIHCILALESVSLTKLYIKSRQAEDGIKYKDKLYECMRDSVSGSWGNKLVPKITRRVGGVEGLEGLEGSPVNWGYMIGVMKNTEGVYYEWKMEEKLIVEKNKEEIIDYLLDHKFVQAMELFLMFFVINYPGDRMKMSIEKAKYYSPKENGDYEFGNEESKKYLCVLISERKIRFDILGFVLNCFDIDSFFDNALDKIENAFLDFCEGEEIIHIKDRINKNSLRKEFEEWQKKYGYLAMPVYSTDIMYNVLKRAKIKCQTEIRHVISEENATDNIKKLFKNIADLLGDEDEFYGTDLEKCFVENPFVNKFINNNLDKNFVCFLNKFIVQFADYGDALYWDEPDMEDPRL